MSIAVVGWGSLIWRPTDHGVTLQIRNPDNWDADGPVLPLEFARISEDGSLTLIVVPDYEHPFKTLWALSVHADSEDAIANLAARENIDEKNRPSIHGVHRDGSRVGSVSTGVAPRVHAWLVEQPDLNAAIWTGLGAGSRWPEHGFPDGLSADNAILYIQSLRKTPDHPAFKYLRNAPDQVRTPVRQRAQTEGIV